MRSALLLLLCLLLAPSSEAQSMTTVALDEAQPAAWITVRDEGRALRLTPGRVIHFQGTGHLAFGIDRTHVRVESTSPLRVLRSPNEDSHPTGDADIIVVRGGTLTEWVIRLASESEMQAAPDAIRIRDAQPDSPARLDSDTPTSFFVLVDEHGGSLFVYPEGP